MWVASTNPYGIVQIRRPWWGRNRYLWYAHGALWWGHDKMDTFEQWVPDEDFWEEDWGVEHITCHHPARVKLHSLSPRRKVD